jgi:hypothetical protein
MTTMTDTTARKINPADFDCEMLTPDAFIREDGAVEAHRVTRNRFVLITEDGVTLTDDDGNDVAVSLLTALRIMRDFEDEQPGDAEDVTVN